jgi:hypothetical protein
MMSEIISIRRGDELSLCWQGCICALHRDVVVLEDSAWLGRSNTEELSMGEQDSQDRSMRKMLSFLSPPAILTAAIARNACPPPAIARASTGPSGPAPGCSQLMRAMGAKTSQEQMDSSGLFMARNNWNVRIQSPLSRSTSRLSVTYRNSVSALAIMHSPRSADFRWPRSRRRQTTPHHSRSSNRLKEETTRPSQFPQDDPSFPSGSGIRTSDSSHCRVAGNPVCRPDPGSARSPGYSCPSVR